MIGRKWSWFCICNQGKIRIASFYGSELLHAMYERHHCNSSRQLDDVVLVVRVFSVVWSRLHVKDTVVCQSSTPVRRQTLLWPHHWNHWLCACHVPRYLPYFEYLLFIYYLSGYFVWSQFWQCSHCFFGVLSGSSQCTQILAHKPNNM